MPGAARDRRHLGPHVTPSGARLDRAPRSPETPGVRRLAHLVRPGRCARRPAHRRRPGAAHARREHGRNVVRWTPVLDDRLTSTVAELAARHRRSASTATGRDHHGEIVDRFVDALVRQSLDDAGWWPDVGRRRDPRSRARHAVVRALAGNPGIAPTGNDPTGTSSTPRSTASAASCTVPGSALAIEPVVVVRIRLVAPSDPLDDWELELQLADEVDPGRWCTAADVWDESSLAVDLAGGRPTGSTRSATPSRPGAEAAGEALPALSLVAPRPDAHEHGARHRRRRVVPRRRSRCHSTVSVSDSSDPSS